jgi:hypothetical protein
VACSNAYFDFFFGGSFQGKIPISSAQSPSEAMLYIAKHTIEPHYRPQVRHFAFIVNLIIFSRRNFVRFSFASSDKFIYLFVCLFGFLIFVLFLELLFSVLQSIGLLDQLNELLEELRKTQTEDVLKVLRSKAEATVAKIVSEECKRAWSIVCRDIHTSLPPIRKCLQTQFTELNSVYRRYDQVHTVIVDNEFCILHFHFHFLFLVRA